jgi:hypothetical protein
MSPAKTRPERRVAPCCDGSNGSEASSPRLISPALGDGQTRPARCRGRFRWRTRLRQNLQRRSSIAVSPARARATAGPTSGTARMTRSSTATTARWVTGRTRPSISTGKLRASRYRTQPDATPRRANIAANEGATRTRSQPERSRQQAPGGVVLVLLRPFDATGLRKCRHPSRKRSSVPFSHSASPADRKSASTADRKREVVARLDVAWVTSVARPVS